MRPARADSIRIVGGSVVTEGAAPWQVIVMQNGGFHCGGTLLSPLWVITAAHCVYGADGQPLPQSDISITVGEYDRSRTDSPDRQTRAIAAIIAHPSFNGMCCDFDIAMLQLSAPVTINAMAQIMRPLSTEQALDVGTQVFATGWGKTDKNGATSTVLRQAVLTVSSNDPAYPYFITSSTGDAVCYGDSGGPLIVETALGPRLAGITSFGGCNPGGGFARVSDSFDWIEETLVSIEVSGPPERRISHLLWQTRANAPKTTFVKRRNCYIPRSARDIAISPYLETTF